MYDDSISVMGQYCWILPANWCKISSSSNNTFNTPCKCEWILFPGCTSDWLVYCVLNAGHCTREAQRGLQSNHRFQPVWGSTLCIPQPHLSDLGGSVWRRRPTVPSPHRKEGRQLSCEVGSKYKLFMNKCFYVLDKVKYISCSVIGQLCEDKWAVTNSWKCSNTDC